MQQDERDQREIAEMAYFLYLDGYSDNSMTNWLRAESMFQSDCRESDCRECECRECECRECECRESDAGSDDILPVREGSDDILPVREGNEGNGDDEGNGGNISLLEPPPRHKKSRRFSLRSLSSLSSLKSMRRKLKKTLLTKK
jgi:hypothetical protein